MKKSILAVPKKEQTNFLLSLVIAAAAAYVDATGFLLYSGVYLSFMSGNTTRAAVLVGRGDWQQVAPAIGVIPTFVLGATTLHRCSGYRALCARTFVLVN
jgi:uncharacterized membrane protein YoaK (UPF0700 family)